MREKIRASLFGKILAQDLAMEYATHPPSLISRRG
jgi:hypothetical protein